MASPQPKRTYSFVKRYALKDFDGKLVDYANLCKPKAVQPFNIQNWMSMASPQPKRTYKKKKHRSGQRFAGDTDRNDRINVLDNQFVDKAISSEDETVNV